MARRNFPSADDRMKRAARKYKQLLKPLKDVLEVAETNTFPDYHLDLIQHFIDVAETLAELEYSTEQLVPKRTRGRPRKEELNVFENCARLFEELTPPLVLTKRVKPAPVIRLSPREAKAKLKRQTIPDSVDAPVEIKPQEGIVFNFDK